MKKTKKRALEAAGWLISYDPEDLFEDMFKSYCESQDGQIDAAQKAIDRLKQHLSYNIHAPDDVDFGEYLDGYILKMSPKELAAKVDELGLRPTMSWHMGRFIAMIKQQIKNPRRISGVGGWRI
jgi:hypothetical protein